MYFKLHFDYSAYHGHVISLIDVSPYKFDHPGGEGKPDWVHVVSNFFFSFFFKRLLSICQLYGLPINLT